MKRAKRNTHRKVALSGNKNKSIMENREKKKNTTHLCRTKQVTNEQILVP